MSDLKLDPVTNDLVLENGDLVITDDGSDDDIVQDVKTYLQTFFAEWFLDTSQGIPYYQSILVKGVDLNLVQVTLIDGIRQRRGVVDVLGLEFNYDAPTRTLSAINAEIKTASGANRTVTATTGGV